MKKQSFQKRLAFVLAVDLCVSALAGCAVSPEKEAVTSKNDGVFQANMTAPATAPLEEQIQYTDAFTSTDGTVEYIMDLQQNISSDPLPIVEVVPHFFTGEEVKGICNVLLGDASWREQVHEKDPQYSKSELQKKISWMSELSSEDAMRQLLGRDPDYGCSEELNILRTEMQRFTVLLETAPEENPRPVCDWSFQDESLYVSPSYGNNVIHAVADVGDLEYTLYSPQRDKNDYKLSSISIQLGDGRSYLDRNRLMARLCRTEKPTQEQVDALTEKAQTLFDQMGVGQWQIARTEVEETLVGGTIPEYRVIIDAVPVLNGAVTLFGQPIEALKSEDANASNYQTTCASIAFSAGGDLVYFDMTSPVDITTVINEGAATLSMEELLDRAKEHLSFSGLEETQDYYLLDLYYENPVSCKITLDGLDFGLIRVRAANKDFTYYYTPALTVYGTTRYYDKGTDREADAFFLDPVPKSRTLVWINAIDGSIIG